MENKEIIEEIDKRIERLHNQEQKAKGVLKKQFSSGATTLVLLKMWINENNKQEGEANEVKTSNESDVCKCPLCENEDVFRFKLTHYKCRKCKNTFTN
jgi:hypothetical protein